jgi:hypothetical protein
MQRHSIADIPPGQPATIQPITLEEFEGARGAVVGGRGRKPSSEAVAVKALGVGMGIKFPCRWNHKQPRISRLPVCQGLGTIWRIGRKHGMKVSPICRDGTVYVVRSRDVRV